MLRTHNCGELNLAHVGQEVTLAGWVSRRRDMGGIVFLVLRDRFGIIQLMVDASRSSEAFQTATEVRGEYVVKIGGVVAPRPDGQANPDMATGEIEVHVDSVEVLNSSMTTPFTIGGGEHVDEALRLRYRYLDLRRERMQRNMAMRHKAIKYIRDFLDERDFLEIETPILFKSTPEGARDYLVPSRVHPGKFYALPQSPQQHKQMLMVSGYDRYFQIARCFRDEDQRSDRQPEFTQLDLEMSFVEREDILRLAEELMVGMVKSTSLVPLAYEEFPRITYAQAMERFGSDRPDVRFGMELVDISEIVASSQFRVFVEQVAAGNRVIAINAPGCARYSRKQKKELEIFARENGARALAWLAVDPEEGTIKGPIAKFFEPEQLKEIADRMDADPGDLMLVIADDRRVAQAALGALRDEMAQRLGFKDQNELAFLWVIDFPLFEEELEDGHYAPSHHMFTAPKPEMIPLLDSAPGQVLSDQYDLVCNGNEVGGGSIRIHDSELQKRVMELIGISSEEADRKFGHMLEAFKYGTPPHGGIAPGIDRILMLMAGEKSIREVIAFPKSQQATDLMADAPSTVPQESLDDLHIALNLPTASLEANGVE